MLLQKALKLYVLLGALSAAVNASLTPVPSEGVYILDDVDGKGGFSGKIQVVSNVPVNLDNYFGSGTFYAGAPLDAGQVKVLVTSNCDTSQHQVQSKIQIDDTAGTITVNLSLDDGSGAAMPFLAPSSFDANWSMSDFWCESENPAKSDGCAVCLNPKTGECEDSESSCFVDPCNITGACPEGETCVANFCGGCHALCSGSGEETATTTSPTKPPDGSTCEPDAECFTEGLTCAEGQESCCGKTYNSLECECNNFDGKLKYQCIATDFCMYPPCCQSGPQENQPPPSPNTCIAMGSPCETGVPDDYCCIDFSSGDGASYCTVTGGIPPISQLVESSPSESSATPAPTPATPGKSDDPKSMSDNNPSAAFTQQRCFAASFVVLVLLVSLLLPGRNNNAQGFVGFGAVAVAAVALSAVVPKKNGTERNVDRASVHARVLETCSFNVEILYDGCKQSISVDAPSARVVDVNLENFTSTPAGDCVIDYDVTLAFPVTDTTKELDLPANNTVDTLPEFSEQCAIIVMGRPYIDSSGEMLSAVPVFPDLTKMNSLASVSWTGEVVVDDEAIPSSNNVTLQHRFLLGAEWTERGLGEHASVASFSAFSIALMTNNAPSDLVEDALKAGMDEIRHARSSFEVASKLLGRPVGPGPLPPSTHNFGHDLTSLAFAVAREGCIDETLSAIVADLEVEDISNILEGTQGNMYSNIERDTLTWIEDEMRTIAKEESSHAALAWRTLNWVCGIDSDICEAVHRDVFEEASLELRFNQRAANSLSDMSTVRDKLKEDWMKIHEVHCLVRSNSDISLTKVSICDESEDGVGAIPLAVLRGMIC
ncbi:hypothetical protein ACHAXM_006107 [Skeletonema potamos]